MKTVAFLALTLAIPLVAIAGEQDAIHLLTISDGVEPSTRDVRIKRISRQLDRIQSACGHNGGAPVGDKIAKAQSLVAAPTVSLVRFLNDFESLALRHCAKFRDTDLLSMYVLGRRAGIDHKAMMNALMTDPQTIKDTLTR